MGMDGIYDGKTDKSYVYQLLQNAESYGAGDVTTFEQVTFLSCIQFEYYFQENRRKVNLMKKKPHIFNEDPKSIINGILPGICFTLTTRTKDHLRYFSTSRNISVHFPVTSLLTESGNLYFADFYHTASCTRPHVTLVISKPGTEADGFCQEHFVRLDLATNKFLRQNTDQTFSAMKKTVFFTEVFYTEDIDFEGVPDSAFFTEDGNKMVVKCLWSQNASPPSQRKAKGRKRKFIRLSLENRHGKRRGEAYSFHDEWDLQDLAQDEDYSDKEEDSGLETYDDISEEWLAQYEYFNVRYRRDANVHKNGDHQYGGKKTKQSKRSKLERKFESSDVWSLSMHNSEW